MGYSGKYIHKFGTDHRRGFAKSRETDAEGLGAGEVKVVFWDK